MNNRGKFLFEKLEFIFQWI